MVILTRTLVALSLGIVALSGCKSPQTQTDCPIRVFELTSPLFTQVGQTAAPATIRVTSHPSEVDVVCWEVDSGMEMGRLEAPSTITIEEPGDPSLERWENVIEVSACGGDGYSVEELGELAMKVIRWRTDSIEFGPDKAGRWHQLPRDGQSMPPAPEDATPEQLAELREFSPHVEGEDQFFFTTASGHPGFRFRFVESRRVNSGDPRPVAYRFKATRIGFHDQEKVIELPGDVSHIHFTMEDARPESVEFVSGLTFHVDPPTTLIGVVAPAVPVSARPLDGTWSQPRIEQPSWMLDTQAVGPLNSSKKEQVRTTAWGPEEGIWPQITDQGFLVPVDEGIPDYYSSDPRQFHWRVIQDRDGSQFLGSEGGFPATSEVQYWANARGYWPRRGNVSLPPGVDPAQTKKVVVKLTPMTQRRIAVMPLVWIDPWKRESAANYLENLVRQRDLLDQVFLPSDQQVHALRQLISVLGQESLGDGPGNQQLLSFWDDTMTLQRETLERVVVPLVQSAAARAKVIKKRELPHEEWYPAELLTGLLTGVPYFQVLERHQTDHFFSERDLSAQDIYDPALRPEFMQLGVEYLLMGSILEKSDQGVATEEDQGSADWAATLSMRLVEVRSGEVLTSVLMEGADLEELLRKAATQLVSKTNLIFRNQDS